MRRLAIIATALMLGFGIASSAPASAAEEGRARIAPVLTDDGLYTQPWFLQSFLDLRDDLADTSAKGKRLAIIWEQRGCPYCKQMHEVNFAIPEINTYIRENFEVLQLNLFGDRAVTDFDGAVLPEKALARKWGVIGTPTIVFLPERAADALGKPGRAAEVERMRGYLPPYEFLGMFQYVRGPHATGQSFEQFLSQRSAALRDQGKAPPAWAADP